MKKRLCYILLVFLLSTLISTTVYAAEGVTLTKGGIANVLQVIDGETIKVEMQDSKDIAYIKLIGVDSSGYPKALDYMNSTLSGKLVSLSFDNKVKTPVDRWNMMYVHCDGVLINQDILDKGYAKISEDTKNASMFNSAIPNTSGYASSGNNNNYNPYYYNPYYSNLNFSDNTDSNNVPFKYINGELYYYREGLYYPYKDLDLGDYYYYYDYNNSYYSGNGVNINTATVEQLQSTLVDVNGSIATNIVNYRSGKSFNTVDDIKKVSGFTTELFNKNRKYMTVSTNINTATKNELLSLKFFTEEDAVAIINYRASNKFTNISELTSEELISKSTYESNSKFISTYDKGILSYDGTGYYPQLPYYNYNPYYGDYNNPYYGNNNSHYGNYNYPYYGNNNYPYYGNNNSYYGNYNYPYYGNGGYPYYPYPYYPYSPIDGKININTATEDQLLRLDYAITVDFAKQIISRRDSSKFESLQDIEDYFYDKNKSDIYNRCKDKFTVK